MTKPNWFIGLPVDTGSWFAPLVRTAPDKVRVFHPQDVHITVAFLGPCGGERARAAWATTTGHAPGPLGIALGKLEPMGNPRRPSALSVVIDRGREPVAQLIGLLRGPAWRAAEAREDDRPPLPHITVARPARRASSSERRTAVEWATGQPPVGAEVVLNRLVLFTWAEDRRLRQFEVVEQRGLDEATAEPSAGDQRPGS